MKTYKEMRRELEENGVEFHETIYPEKFDTYEEALQHSKGGDITALSKNGGLLAGYAHYFDKHGNGYMYSIIYNEKTKKYKTVNIYERG